MAGLGEDCPPGGRAYKASKPGPGWPGLREMAGTGTEQTRCRSGNQRVVSNCDAECDAIAADRIELLARALIVLAGKRILEAVLARLTAGRA